MKHTMESNNDCSLPFKLWTQLEVDVEQNLNKGSPRSGDHVDVWVCNFKTPKGFFLEPIYNENNWKPQVTNSNSRAVGSTIRLQLATKESVVDLQGSKGVAPKAKFKLKPQKAIGRHRGAQPTFTQVVPSNPLSEDEDEFCYILGTTTNAMIQKHVIPDLDQEGPGENWHTQKR